MQSLVVESERAWQAIGRISYGPTGAEQGSVKFRRSLYVVEDIKAGHLLTRENVRAIRPGLGLAPKYLDSVLAMQVRRDVKRGTPLTWDLVR